MITDRVERYIRLSKINDSKNEREELLRSMNNFEIDYLIANAGNQTARIYYKSFKK